MSNEAHRPIEPKPNEPVPHNASGAPRLTHIDQSGAAHMVDVSAKGETKRIARAEGFISMQPATLAMIAEGTAKKGDVLAVARIAGIMAAKQTSSLIPLCHPLLLTSVDVDLQPIGHDTLAPDTGDGEALAESLCGVRVVATVALSGKTGVEMEALTATSVACLTIYDMCKAVDRGMVIEQVRLLHKEGGKSGTWTRP